MVVEEQLADKIRGPGFDSRRVKKKFLLQLFPTPTKLFSFSNCLFLFIPWTAFLSYKVFFSLTHIQAVQSKQMANLCLYSLFSFTHSWGQVIWYKLVLCLPSGGKNTNDSSGWPLLGNSWTIIWCGWNRLASNINRAGIWTHLPLVNLLDPIQRRFTPDFTAPRCLTWNVLLKIWRSKIQRVNLRWKTSIGFGLGVGLVPFRNNRKSILKPKYSDKYEYPFNVFVAFRPCSEVLLPIPDM